ncbi:hypothetical protein BDZ94DRAFT_1241503 [Collybia nuda]|uniref:Pentatricopeptide repeat domain-containing protein n=1 Tax=Collybia nuda TaxID=64659 RepID=A0A9P5XTB3_9AGAR|nr:hypothetical protein BDZ94DRAFT_1241503 [Collybia nuda]
MTWNRETYMLFTNPSRLPPDDFFELCRNLWVLDVPKLHNYQMMSTVHEGDPALPSTSIFRWHYLQYLKSEHKKHQCEPNKCYPDSGRREQVRHDMRLFGLLKCLKYSRVGNPFLIGWRGGYATPHFTQRFASTLTSRKLPTSIRYSKNPNSLTAEQGNLKLVKLVQESQYGDANRLRLQLIDNGIEIRRHHTFEKAAVSALRWDNLDKCLEEFTAWFSLVPNADEAFPPSLFNPFQNIRHALLQSGLPSKRLPVILQFGLMSASKGYTEPIFREVFQCVAKYEIPKTCCTHMLKFEKAATQYQLDRNPTNAPAIAQKYRVMIIEICTQLGWLYLAYSIVRMKRDFPLPRQTTRFLLERVESTQRPFAKSLISRLCEEQGLSAIGITTSYAHLADKYPAYPTLQQDHPLPLDPWHVSVARLARTFRAPSLPAIGLKSRMLAFLDHHRNYIQVLDLFSANFVKFDLGRVFDHTLSRILATIPNPEPEPRAPTPFPFPEDYQWIIFKAIARLSTSLPWPLATLESLYEAFLHHPYIEGTDKVFGTFISEFGRCGAVNQAEMVIHDLRLLGILPDYSHLGRLAGVYAQAGRVDQAMDILDELERPTLINGETGVRFRPRFTTYGRIMEGFVKAGMLEPALAVEARMKEVLPYVRERNPGVDRVLDAMRALQPDKTEAALDQG